MWQHKEEMFLHIKDSNAAQGCIQRLDEIVELIVALISEKIIEKVRRRTSNHELIPSKKEDADQNRIDLNFGEIHEEVKAPNYNTMEIFVPYGVPTIGSYGMTAFMDGIPITDKKTNYMRRLEYGFYVTDSVLFDDFRGISDLVSPSRRFESRRATRRRSA